MTIMSFYFVYSSWNTKMKIITFNNNSFLMNNSIKIIFFLLTNFSIILEMILFISFIKINFSHNSLNVLH